MTRTASRAPADGATRGEGGRAGSRDREGPAKGGIAGLDLVRPLPWDPSAAGATIGVYSTWPWRS